jgi:hypothetical protein
MAVIDCPHDGCGKQVSIADRLYESLHVGQCPVCGEWFRLDEDEGQACVVALYEEPRRKGAKP